MGGRAGSEAGPERVWQGASRPALAQRCERMAIATGLIAVSSQGLIPEPSKGRFLLRDLREPKERRRGQHFERH